MKKILYITNIPSPYRISFFNKLGEECNLTVLFERSFSEERDKIWKNYEFKNFTGIVLDGINTSVNTSFCLNVLRYINDEWDEIVCCNFSTPTGILAIQYMKIRNIKYWIEGDGGFAKNSKGIKEKIKRYLISGAKGYFSTSDALDNYYLTYGAKFDKIHRYKFSSISKDEIINLGSSNKSNQIIKRNYLRKITRNELGIDNEKIIVLTVGRFIHIKGFDLLLESAAHFKRNVCFYFVGGEPTKEYESILKKNKLKNIEFINFQEKEKLMKYYTAADIFVLPTRSDMWGLVINEAMSNALPVITTKQCVAGLEMVKNNRNGYLIETDCVSSLTNKINILVNNAELREEYGINSRKTALKYTIETMVASHSVLFKEDFN